MDASIWVALISGLSLVVVAVIPIVVLRRGQTTIKAQQEDIAASVGHKNGDNSLVEQNVLLIHEIVELRESFDRHAALDTQRFRSLHNSLNIPFLEDT